MNGRRIYSYNRGRPATGYSPIFTGGNPLFSGDSSTASDRLSTLQLPTYQSRKAQQSKVEPKPYGALSSPQPYVAPSFPYRRAWTGFNAVVAIHPSQLRQRTRRRYLIEDLPVFLQPNRPRRVSSTTWETPKGGDKNFADVINNAEYFHARIDLGMFEYFEKEEIDVNLYGYDILIYACKDNPIDPNRPARVLNRQYRLPDDIDLQTVKLDRPEDKSEVGVDAKKIPTDYGRARISFRITDVTESGRKAEQMQSF